MIKSIDLAIKHLVFRLSSGTWLSEAFLAAVRKAIHIRQHTALEPNKMLSVTNSADD